MYKTLAKSSSVYYYALQKVIAPGFRKNKVLGHQSLPTIIYQVGIFPAIEIAQITER